MQTTRSPRSLRSVLLRWTGVAATALVVATASVVACSSAPDQTGVDNGSGSSSGGQPPSGGACTHPTQGCSCDTPNEKAACGTQSGSGTQTSCALGTITCQADHTWGACDPHEVPPATAASMIRNERYLTPKGVPQGEHVFHSSGVLTLPLQGPGAPVVEARVRPFASVTDAGCNDPCDPYCSTIGDNSNGVDGGTGLADLDGGWTLSDVPIPPDAIPPCSGNQCYVAQCDAGQATTLTGRVMDPAGNYPVPNALVMVPNYIVTPMGTGLSYDPCSSANLPQGLAYGYTDSNGYFSLGTIASDAGSVPTLAYPPTGTGDAGAPIPLMIQVGRWRRLTTVNSTGASITIPNACGANDAGAINLPSTQGGQFNEDNIPHIAVLTSSCDPMECLLNDFGIDRTQFSQFNGGGRVELLWSNEIAYPGTNPGLYNLGGDNVNSSGAGLAAAMVQLPDGGLPDVLAGGYDQLFNTTSTLDNYDMVMLPCRCADEYEGPNSAGVSPTDLDDQRGYRQALVSYANAGGRVFTSHWGREWIERAATSDGGAGVCNGPTCNTSATTSSQCTGSTCTWNEACGASASSQSACQAQTTQTGCFALDAGCGWNGACGQTTNSCGSQTTQTACGALDAGCSWTGSCTGTPSQIAACTSLTSQSTCTGQSCPPYTTNCGGTCKPTAVDPSNCGGCGVVCTTGTVCTGGACVTTGCLAPNVACGTQCVDPNSSNTNCGATTGCGSGGVGSAGTNCTSLSKVCVAGTCVAASQSLGSADAGSAMTCPTSITVNGVDAGVGGISTTACTGNLAQRAFTWGICSQENISSTQTLTIDAYDSTNGPYVAGILGGGVGANGGVIVTQQDLVSGTLWAAGGVSKASQPTTIEQDVHSGADYSGSISTTTFGNAYVNGNVAPSSWSISGTLNQSPGFTVSNTTYGSRVNTSTISVANPCGAGANIPVANIVSYASTHCDNTVNGPDGTYTLSSSALANIGVDTRVDLPCGNFYFTSVGGNGNHNLTIVAHGITAIFIGGDLAPPGTLVVTLDPGATLDVFVGGGIGAGGVDNNAVYLGNPGYPSAMRVYVGGNVNGSVISNPATILTAQQNFKNASVFINCDFWVGMGTFTTANKSTVYGSLYVGNLNVGNDTTVHYDRASLSAGSACPVADAGTSSTDAGSDGGDAGSSTPGCASCADCNNQACINGACGSCTSDSQCCPPLVCQSGTCVLPVTP